MGTSIGKLITSILNEDSIMRDSKLGIKFDFYKFCSIIYLRIYWLKKLSKSFLKKISLNFLFHVFKKYLKLKK
jgi:hypothetical protein